jgi:hypothetical protein
MAVSDRFHQSFVIGLGETSGINKRLDHTRFFCSRPWPNGGESFNFAG